MLALRPNLIVGFHGCDEAARDRLLAGDSFVTKAQDYHWLGQGAYFWECDPERALAWAAELMAFQAKKRMPDQITKPALVGALIAPGRCLDLSVTSDLNALKTAYATLKEAFEAAGKPLPVNKAPYLRRLDCAVIDFLCNELTDQISPIDTVRGYFVEGSPVFPGSLIYDKNHIQICVRNPDCILGVFPVQDRLMQQSIAANNLPHAVKLAERQPGA